MPVRTTWTLPGDMGWGEEQWNRKNPWVSKLHLGPSLCGSLHDQWMVPFLLEAVWVFCRNTTSDRREWQLRPGVETTKRGLTRCGQGKHQEAVCPGEEGAMTKQGDTFREWVGVGMGRGQGEVDFQKAEGEMSHTDNLKPARRKLGTENWRLLVSIP